MFYFNYKFSDEKERERERERENESKLFNLSIMQSVTIRRRLSVIAKRIQWSIMMKLQLHLMPELS